MVKGNKENRAAAAEMVFTMGLPGSGKSTTLARLGLTDTHRTIDPDAHKQSHPDYDPKNPAALHAWSNEKAEAEFQGALTAGTGLWIVDGTGTNAEKMIRRIRQAKAAGFTVRLVYVRVILQTALERNAARERTVPETVVREKALDITTAFALTKDEADTVVVVDND